MKRQFVDMLQEGDLVNDYFVATRKDLRTQQNGSKFLGMVFKDRTGDIGGILWNNAASVAQLFEVGDVVNVRGSITSYQDRLQVRVDQVLPLREGEYDTADLIQSIENIPEVFDKFRKLLENIQNPKLLELVQAFLNDTVFMRRFMSAAAGKKWHHAFPGGLVLHCYEMACIAETMCALFPNIDRDILLAGIFFHDAGKIEEMSHDLCVDYTTPGKLLGHLTIGVTMLEERIKQITDFPEKLRIQLLHCILAHHGEFVNGSPVVPKTIEAVVLYHIDNLDAQANAITRVVEETRSRGQSWSEYLPHIDRQIWTKDE